MNPMRLAKPSYSAVASVTTRWCRATHGSGLFALALLLGALPAAVAATVAVLQVDGAVSPASADYIVERGIARDHAQGASLVVPQIDTPGGLGRHERDGMLSERERRAKVIHADGEKQASATLLEAAQMPAQSPQAMQLRYLQTLTQIAGERSSTIVFPLPIDLLTRLSGSGPEKSN